MAMNWTEIGATLGTIVASFGVGFIATRKRTATSPLEPLDDAMPQYNRQATDKTPQPCGKCDLDNDMDELRDEMKDGFHSLETRLNSIETAHEVQASKSEELSANVAELFKINRDLSASVHELIGEIRAGRR